MDENLLEAEVRRAANFRQENPSLFYKVVPGQQQYGFYKKTYRVMRIRDGQLFTLKFLEPRSAEEKAQIEYEIGLM